MSASCWQIHLLPFGAILGSNQSPTHVVNQWNSSGSGGAAICRLPVGHRSDNLKVWFGLDFG